MNRAAWSTVIAAAWTLAAGAAASGAESSRPLCGFETDADVRKIWTLKHAVAALSADHVTEGKRCAKVTFSGKETNWPAILLSDKAALAGWEKYDYLALEVFNPAQFEDFDFCYRAREAGWTVLYDPVAEMYHFESVTTDNSPDVNYKYVTIRNGMEFKRRWRHVFEHEDGPPDGECRWQTLETRPIEQTGIPSIID